ncbi:lachesin-like [Arctopsyche grandis]|uniref:lachesin-like n=1 Tax=Arctopsyche grandis TaxID=121162 RepID=UPI00406D9A20
MKLSLFYQNPIISLLLPLSCRKSEMAVNIIVDSVKRGETHTALVQLPKFGDMISNVTVSVGREATFTCIVDDLGSYRVAWLRVDTQTILTIGTHVITKNHRIGVTQSDRRSWFLHVKDVRELDRGWYMCQINTDPMKSHTAFLEVVVPPDILEYPTSGDLVAREGTSVTLKCAAAGSPSPKVSWRREGGEAMPAEPVELQQTSSMEASAVGSMFTITRVNRLHMGAYLCIATNGVPPSVSKRITLIVHFPPMVWIQNQLIGARETESVTLECHSEAFPKSINYWTFDGEIISQADDNCEISTTEKTYEVDMRLKIKRVTKKNYGSYRCVSKNSLGDTDGNIKLYPIPSETSLKKHNSPYYHDSIENEASDSKSENNVIQDDTNGADNKMAAAIQSDASVDGKSVVASTNTSNGGKSNFKSFVLKASRENPHVIHPKFVDVGIIPVFPFKVDT